MAQQLNSANYAAINDTMNTLLGSGTYSGINATIYTDANQTSIYSDAAGPIQARKISQITHVADHVLANGNPVNASITLVFSDGTSLTATDGVDDLYYSLEGVVFQPRRFGA